MRILLALFVALAACQTSPPSSSVNDAPPLIAISNFVHPPFSSRNESGKAIGIEIDIIAEAARRLGREVEWRERAFGELIGAVAAGEADVAAATLGITAERAELVTFSESYYRTSIVALVREGEREPKTLADLEGLVVATDPGTTGVPAIRNGVPGAVLRTNRGESESWGELLATGDVDAVVIDHSHAETFMKTAGTRFHVIAEPLAEERFGLATQHQASELRAALDAAIRER